MKKILALFLAFMLALSLAACGTKSTAKAEDKTAESKPVSEKVPELYVTDVDGTATVVDADGKAISGYKLDDGGSIVDGSGKVIVAAAQVRQLPAKAEEQPKTEQPKPDTKAEDAKSDSSDSASSGDSSSGGSSSGGSVSSSSSDSSSGASGGSGSSAPAPTAPPQPVHTHSWQPVYRDVEVDDYEMQEVSYCVTCGQDMTGWNQDQLDDHGIAHLLRGESDQWRSEGRYVRVGSHIEQELTGYVCSCGATKGL